MGIYREFHFRVIIIRIYTYAPGIGGGRSKARGKCWEGIEEIKMAERREECEMGVSLRACRKLWGLEVVGISSFVPIGSIGCIHPTNIQESEIERGGEKR